MVWPSTSSSAEALPRKRLGNSLRFDRSELAIDAARRSQGLVLTSPWLVEDDIEQGRLVQAFTRSLGVGKAYYLVRRGNVPQRASVELFRKWIINCADQIAPAQ